MEIFDKIIQDKVLRTIAFILLSLAIIILITFFIQYNIDRSKGIHSKFLWFETNISTEQKNNSIPKIDNSKNINTGTNFGNIGDKYEGIKQRNLTNEDVKKLINELDQFKNNYRDKINFSHITIGYPGDKESSILAKEVENVLQDIGYQKIELMILQTFGVTGKKIGISNAPDDSILVEIYPADNVE